MQLQNIQFSEVAHVRKKLISVCSQKRRLNTINLVYKYKALKEIDIAT